MENLKVFELAKQMGIETLALMDKLREFKIPVKSHMAELDDTLISQIKARFDEEKAKPAAKPKATKVARPKKVAAAGDEPAKPAKKVATGIVKATKAAAKQTPIARPITTKSLKAAEAAISRTVIRRKGPAAEETGEAEAVVEEAAAPAIDTAGEEVFESAPEATEVEQVVLAAPPVPEAPKTTVVVEQPVVKAPEKRNVGRTAQVISRIDLRDTMGDNAPRQARGPAAANLDPQKAAAAARAASQQVLDTHKFDKEHIGKLIRQEALAQAKKASALARENAVDVFNAADFRKREMLFQPKKKKVLTGRSAQKTQITKPGEKKRRIKVDGQISVAKLAQELGVKGAALIKKLVAMGSMVALNDVLDFDTAHIIAQEHGFELENTKLTEEAIISNEGEIVESGEMITRPPIVTVMGHVDHGKTSLLDAIRKAEVAAGEAGGITQHIGAYSVDVDGRKITFLDTPGHEAFTAMRARGAKVTDIVILVVAADDGVMPQTREAITHAKAAGVPIIIAINKMDSPKANPEKVLQTLTEFELVPEEWGGTTIVAKVSALKKQGIKELLEMILLQADVLELKANPDRAATGTVIEARLDRGRGPVATMIVQKGTAHVGDTIVAGMVWGRVRAMVNDKGAQIKTAGPGMPVEVIGLSGVPSAGDIFDVVTDEETAEKLVESRVSQLRDANKTTSMKMSLDQLFAKVQQNEFKELPVIVKCDVQGSVEALKELLGKTSTDKVKLKIISTSVGGVTESDVLLASASHAIIIGFNVRPETGVGAIAEREGIQIRTYSIIYDVVDDLKKAMLGLLDPKFEEKALGRAEVRSLFSVPKIGTVAGCSVIDGKITRQAGVRLLRDSRVIYEGKLASLRRFKDDVKEVQSGFECGIGIENYNDLKVGDVIEAFVKEQVEQSL